jgi:hypothetical protein
MPDGVVTSVTADQLVAVVRAQVTELAQGNPFPKEDFSFDGSRRDRIVGLTMRVEVASKGTSQNLQGQAEPAGSTRSRDATACAEFLAAAFARVARASDTLDRIAGRLKAAPAQAFAETQDGFEIGVVAGRCHFHLACTECGQTGDLDCGRCKGRGRTRCHECSDGKRSCHLCVGGVVHYTDRVWSPASQAYVDQRRSQHCSHCHGSGRAGNCHFCNGLQNVPCNGCGGRGTVGCGTCGRTGWLTVATTIRLVGKPVRASSFEADVPPEFRRGILSLPMTDLPVVHGKVVRSSVEEADGRVCLAIECVIPHVTLQARFSSDFTQRIDAVGLLAKIASMPTFLDGMLKPAASEIRQAAGDRRFADVLRLAKGTRVTSSVLAAVSGRERRGLVGIQAIWKGAASDAMLEGLLEHVTAAYDGIGSAAARKPWKLLALPIVASATAAFPCHVAKPLLNSLPVGRPPFLGGELILDAAIGLLPFALTFAAAGWSARHSVRAHVGKNAIRIPDQGWWARGVGIAALVALVTGAWVSRSPVDPRLGPSPMRVTPLAAQPVANGPVRMHLLAASPLPRLKPVSLVERARGSPDIYGLQSHLRQLGFLHAVPDGAVHASTYDALAMFNDTLPPTQKRVKLGRDAVSTAAAALHDEFVLQRLPVDRFPVPGLSNLARANLTGMDVEFMKRAATEARASPGQEIRWRSADGARGGRLVATRMPMGCPLLQAEVEIRGAVEVVGPFPFCRDQRP